MLCIFKFESIENSVSANKIALAPKSPMKQAFLILAHKNLEQVKFLADSIIDAADNSVYIHVDAKSNDLYAELALYYSNDCRVTIIGDRQCVYWADFSQVKATLNLLTKAAQAKYDYFSLISAQDYPIKPLEQFNSFLAKDRGREFIEARIRNNTWRVKLAHRHIRHPRFRKYRYYRYYALLLSLINYRPKQYVNQYKIYFGSQWFTITQDAVSFILKFVESNPGFMADFASSTCGDEHFFPNNFDEFRF